MEHPSHRTSDDAATTRSTTDEQPQIAANGVDQLSRDWEGRIELPRGYDEAPMDALVELIADMLQRLITHNDQIPLSPEALTRFHSRTPPAISVLDYLRRIVKYANVERTCLLITLHYIDQLCARMPHFTLSSLTAHRFVIAAVVVASKALCDGFCTNAHYARVGGIRVGELNVLERELLSAIDWRLTSTREVLDAYYVNLIRTHSAGIYVLAPLSRSASPVSPTSPCSDSDMDGVRSNSPQDPTLSPCGLHSSISVPTSALRSSASVSVSVPLSAPSVTTESVPLTAHHSHTHNTICNSTDNIISTQHPPTSQVIGPSTVLISTATLSPRPTSGPTLEQNMAFASLRDTTSSAPVTSGHDTSYIQYDYEYEGVPPTQFAHSPHSRPTIPMRSPKKTSSRSPTVPIKSSHSSPRKSPFLQVSSRRNSGYDDIPDIRVVPQRRPAVENVPHTEDNLGLVGLNGTHVEKLHEDQRPKTRPKIEQESRGRVS